MSKTLERPPEREAPTEAERPLWRNRDFMLLWAAQAISQSTQNAIFYTLMVYIESTTGSSTQMSILVLTTVLPTIVFGVIAGVFVDRAGKKTILVVTNLIRAALVVGFIFAQESAAVIFLFNLVFSITSQFFTPAEAAVIPILVGRRQLLAANGIFNLTFSSAQLAGFVLVGPPLVKLFGTTTLYVVIVGAFLICAVLTFLLPSRDPGRDHLRAATAGRQILESVRQELVDGWELLRGDRLIKLAIVYVTVTTTLTLVMGMLAPGYVTRVIGVRPDDSVFVMAPAGIGIIAGIIGLSRWRVAKTLAINVGLFGMGLALFGLAVVQPVIGLIPVPEIGPMSSKWLLVGSVMALAFVLGVAFGLVQVPGQTILAERAPAHMRGKVFAVQLTLGSVISVGPLLLLGGLADVFGVTSIIVALATAITGLAIVSQRLLQQAGDLGASGPPATEGVGSRE